MMTFFIGDVQLAFSCLSRRDPSSKYLAGREPLYWTSFFLGKKGQSILSCVESCLGPKNGHVKNGHAYKIQVTSDLFILFMFDLVFLVTYCRKMCDKRISPLGSLSRKLTACSFEMTRYSVVQMYIE